MTPRRALALLATLLTLTATFGAPFALAAAAPAHRTTLTDVEDEVMCVACGVPLVIAESPQADRERVYIQQLVDRGLTKDQVKSALVETYTARVLAMPEKKGFGLVAFIVPIAVVLAALVGLAIGLPRWRRRRRDDDGRPNNNSPALDAGDAQRLADDLASYKL
jgi:cytochrome c-type biogenesis protein CcmH